MVELFGAVREGPNVVLFMDLKPGKSSPQDEANMSTFIPLCSNLSKLPSVFSSASQGDELLT